MDIEDGAGLTEYILPCAVNILSEDDIIIEIAISGVSISIVYLVYVYSILTLSYIRYIYIFIGSVYILKKNCRLWKVSLQSKHFQRV